MQLIKNLSFAEPSWLIAILIAPLISLVYLIATKKSFFSRTNLSALIDGHLLPHLIVEQAKPIGKAKRLLFLFNLIWILSVIAFSGPRWGFTQVPTYKTTSGLMIVMDMSQSMMAEDVKPNRLTRAKQEILDIINQIKVINIGVIGFAEYPHLVVPLTEDRETIKTLIPVLDSKFIQFQGKDVAAAIKLAVQQLDKLSAYSKSILLITDGQMSDDMLKKISEQINAAKINFFILGVGTKLGAPYKDFKGNLYQENGGVVISKLNKQKLKKLAQLTNGIYKNSDPLDAMFKTMNKKLLFINDEYTKEPAMLTIWHERFYWFLAPAIFLLLSYLIIMRQEILVLIIVFILVYPQPSYAAGIKDYFKSKEQLALEYYKQKNYVQALHNFVDPYRQGVAAYRAGMYNEAEQAFKTSVQRMVTVEALYNLGNSQALQGKLQEAIVTYEKVLEIQPNYKEAQENLNIIKKLLEQQKDKNKESENKEQNQNKDESSQENKEQKEPEQQKQHENSNSRSAEKPAEPETDKDTETKAEPIPEKSAADIKADKWLNQLDNDLKTFLYNKFYIEEAISNQGKN